MACRFEQDDQDGKEAQKGNSHIRPLYDFQNSDFATDIDPSWASWSSQPLVLLGKSNSTGRLVVVLVVVLVRSLGVLALKPIRQRCQTHGTIRGRRSGLRALPGVCGPKRLRRRIILTFGPSLLTILHCQNPHRTVTHNRRRSARALVAL
jgi:hypothetical protein